MSISLYTTNNQINPAISTFIESQVPGFIRDDANSNFVAFLQSYYQWMEQIGVPSPNATNIIYQARNLLSYDDIDSTINAFLQYYVNDFLPYFPNATALDTAKLIKIARKFYQAKGTPYSLQLLFQFLYNEQINIYYPKNNILRASAGIWTQPQALRLLITQQYQNFNISLLVNKLATGANSGAQCVIESAVNTVDPGLGFEITEIYISGLTKEFDDLEYLNVTYGTDANGKPLVFSEQIISELSEIIINPNYQGLLYQTGDPVVIVGGLKPNDPNATKAVAYVGNVTTGSITAANVIFGGFDYRNSPNTLVKVVNAPGDTTGTGANIQVTALDVGNSTYANIALDSLYYKANVALNVANYGFANFAFANANTALNLALQFANLQFAPILEVTLENGGGAYQAVPSVQMNVVYYTDYTNDLANIADYTDVAKTEQYIDDLGMFANVTVLFGGNGYSNVTDAIYPQGVWGNGASFGFITGANGTIKSVSITSPGGGYFIIPPLLIANSTNSAQSAAGQGAILQGYGYGQGANIGLAVDAIGQIESIDMRNRGFDYISTPNVSLRIQDVSVNTISNVTLSYNNLVYQGINANSASYIAYIDSYVNGVIRLYDYKGSLNIYQNIEAPIIGGGYVNVQVNVANIPNVTTYGNGLAKANAQFLNGLINYPGYWYNTDGQLSMDQYLQDANTYHNYSYQIYSAQSLRNYKYTVSQIAHPAGMSMLGVFQVPANESEKININANVLFQYPVSGTVNCDAFSNGVVVGTNTTFIADNTPNVNMIIFNISDSSRLLQNKLIKNVVNNSYLLLESNTAWTYMQPVSILSGSNVIYSSSNNLVGNIAVNDVILINISGNLVYSNISNVSSNQLIGNVVFGSNLNNTLIAVYPTFINASYTIVSVNTAANPY